MSPSAGGRHPGGRQRHCAGDIAAPPARLALRHVLHLQPVPRQEEAQEEEEEGAGLAGVHCINGYPPPQTREPMSMLYAKPVMLGAQVPPLAVPVLNGGQLLFYLPFYYAKKCMCTCVYRCFKKSGSNYS